MKQDAGRLPYLLITRPQAPGRALAAQLRATGMDALWWPAFALLPPEDPAALRSSVERLGLFDLVVFVSPAAVHALAPLLKDAWPARVAIAAVGAATARAARTQLPQASQARMICPDGDETADGGSESLWEAIRQAVPAPRHVLIVRAQAGRRWLADRLLGSGIKVDEAIAYRRVAHVPTAPQWAALRAAMQASAPLAALFSSSEAVGVVGETLGRDPAIAAWLLRGVALCIHERIEHALRASGMTDVRRCEPDVASIRRALGLVHTGAAFARRDGAASGPS
ncbi:MAG TPA: uroporphyrinogen-III synthase [Burkholderiaceae bacterium]|nr:uroporphyrinogen-III synthase [Burkholderiaceae bacterium]